MLTLADIILLLFPTARPPIDWEVTDTGTGPRLTRWNEALLGPTPTPAALEARRSEADAAAAVAAAAVAARAADRAQVKLLVAALRAGTGTTAQRFVRCERALARLIEDLL